MLLGSFAAVIYLTMTGGQEPLVVLGFLVMFSVVGVNYFYVHGIRPGTIAEQLEKDEEIHFTAFGSRLLSLSDAGRPRAQAHSERGRLVVTSKALRFYVKKEAEKDYKIFQTFYLPVEDIEAAGLGQVLSSSQGLIVTGTRNREAHFAIFGMGKKFSAFKAALGWKE